MTEQEFKTLKPGDKIRRTSENQYLELNEIYTFKSGTGMDMQLEEIKEHSNSLFNRDYFEIVLRKPVNLEFSIFN